MNIARAFHAGVVEGTLDLLELTGSPEAINDFITNAIDNANTIVKEKNYNIHPLTQFLNLRASSSDPFKYVEERSGHTCVIVLDDADGTEAEKTLHPENYPNLTGYFTHFTPPSSYMTIPELIEEVKSFPSLHTIVEQALSNLNRGN